MYRITISDRCAEWLTAFLKDGPKKSSEVHAAAREQGFTRAMTYSTAQHLVTSDRAMWRLAEATDERSDLIR